MARGTEEDWLRPEKPLGQNPSQDQDRSGQAGAAMFELRPLSLGEVLDRTFALYRSRFWLFAGITAVSASVQVIVQGISLATAHKLLRGVAGGVPRGTSPMLALHQVVGAQLGTWIAALAFFLISAVANAATTLALSEVYLNRPASARDALAAAFKRWYRWIAIGLWLLGSMLWPLALALTLGALLVSYGARANSTALIGLGSVSLLLALFVAFPIGFVLYLRNSLAIPAAMVEKLTVRAAMRRSKGLAAGTKGRIFVVLLIAGVLYLVVAVLESPATVLMAFAPKQEHYMAQAVTLLISFLGHTLVAPIGLIGLTLIYFDQRVRKEALDLQLLLEGNRPPAAADGSRIPPPAPPPVPSQESASLG